MGWIKKQMKQIEEQQEKENKLGNVTDIDDDGDTEMKDTTVTDGTENNKQVEVTTKDANDTDTDNSGGVFFQ